MWATACGCQDSGQHGRIVAVREGQQQEGLAIRTALAQLGGQRFGHRGAGKLTGGAQPDAEQDLVGRAQLLQEERQAGGLPGQDGAADGFELFLPGHVCGAHGVVELYGFGGLALGDEPFGANNATFGNGGPHRVRRG